MVCLSVDLGGRRVDTGLVKTLVGWVVRRRWGRKDYLFLKKYNFIEINDSMRVCFSGGYYLSHCFLGIRWESKRICASKRTIGRNGIEIMELLTLKNFQDLNTVRSGE